MTRGWYLYHGVEYDPITLVEVMIAEGVAAPGARDMDVDLVVRDVVDQGFLDFHQAPIKITRLSMSLTWAAGYIEGCGAFSAPNRRLNLPAIVRAPVSNPTAARELCMLFPGSRIMPSTQPLQWVATGETAIVVMRTLLPYLRISAHAVEVFL